MSLKRSLFLICATFCLVGCSRVIYAPVVEVRPAIAKYRYVYIVPTSGLTSGYSYVTSSSGAVYGGGKTSTINPSDVISGDLMARGYAILPELNEELLDKTMVVNYGETSVVAHNGRIYDAVILQLRDAKTAELVSSVKADGDGLRDAILRALDGVFLVAKPYFKSTIIER